MGYTDPMTWRASTRNWTKKLTAEQAEAAGKKFLNVSCRQLVKAGLLNRNAPQTKEASRAAMRKWWEAKQAELEPAKAPTAEDIATRLNSTDPEEQGQAYLDHFEQQLAELGVEPTEENSVSKCSRVWLAKLQRQVKANSWDVHRCHIERFASWMENSSLDSVDGRKLESWNEHLRDLVEAGEITSTYASAVWATTVRFVRWAYQTERLEALPRNIDDKGLTIAKGTTTPQTLSTAEVKKLLAAADERRKLYLLLMLNCGFTQIDVANLKQDAVNWTKKTISRKREKTATHKAVPYVTYPLWPETYKLLKQFKSQHPEFVLVNSKGEPLHSQKIKPNGKLGRTCNVTSALKRLIKAEKMKCSPKLLRKTAASKLDEHDTYGRYAQYFLGHAPQSVAERHYVKPSQTQFNAAVKWLGEQF